MRKSNKTPRVARISTGLRKVSEDCNLSFFLIPVLVTGIQQSRVGGAGSVLSAQGLGLAAPL
jgi:hypothetical protein